MENEDNFQTANMIYKLEKIKKRKHKKYPKKMDMFDILENPIGNIKKSILGEQPTNGVIEPFDQNISAEKSKTIEPFSFDKNSFEGVLPDIVRKNDANKIDSFNNDLKDRINKAYDTVSGFNRHLAFLVAIAMSGKPPTEVSSLDDERIWWGIKKRKKKSKEGFSWDLDPDVGPTHQSLDMNLDYKLEDQAVLAKDKAEIDNDIANITSKLFGGETVDGGASPADIDIIQKYIGYGEALLLASYAVYNWYYMMFYLERGAGNNNGEEDVRIRFSRQFFEDIGKGTAPPKGIVDPTVAFIILFLFEFPIFFPEMLDKLLFDWVPKYAGKILNGAFCFIILFYLLTYIFANYVYEFKKFFIDYIDGNLKNPFLGTVLAIMVVLYVMSLYKFFVPASSKAKDMINKKLFKAREQGSEPGPDIALQTIMTEYKELADSSIKYSMMSIAKFVLFDVLARILVTITIGVPVAVFLIGAYIFIYSFFGIFLYQNIFKYGIPSGGFWDKDSGENIFDFIVNHIKDKHANFDYKDEPESYMEYFTNVLVLMNNFSNIMYGKIFTIGCMIILLCSCFDFLNLTNVTSILPIKSIRMKELLILFVLFLCIAIASYAYSSADTNELKTQLLASTYNEYLQTEVDKNVEAAKEQIDKLKTAGQDLANRQEEFVKGQTVIQTDKLLDKVARLNAIKELEKEKPIKYGFIGFSPNPNKITQDLLNNERAKINNRLNATTDTITNSTT